ncbi:hypothetical protein L5515_019248 [Caenorhabditis briggsae]|uniref:Uncharacterized protein n=1 Tax=Caenorhabditis briggsae TaxID=6238 RepID=A0AAE9FLA3_CAEBR|nr:hypothetical protein L5515_019248 [Caenorhabditis briggsae]
MDFMNIAMPRKPYFGFIPLKMSERPSEPRGEIELENTQEIDGAQWRFGIGSDPYEPPWFFVNSEDVSCCSIHVKIVLQSQKLQSTMIIFKTNLHIPERHQQFVTSSSVEEYYNDETAVLYALIKILPVDVRWGNPFAFSESSLYFNDLFLREPANNLVDWTAENFLEILCGVFHGNEEVEVENVYLHLFFAKMFDCPEAAQRVEYVLINGGTEYFEIDLRRSGKRKRKEGKMDVESITRKQEKRKTSYEEFRVKGKEFFGVA